MGLQYSVGIILTTINNILAKWYIPCACVDDNGDQHVIIFTSKRPLFPQIKFGTYAEDAFNSTYTVFSFSNLQRPKINVLMVVSFVDGC